MFKRDPDKSAQKSVERAQKKQERADAMEQRKAEKEALKEWRELHPAEKSLNSAALMHLWPSSKFGVTSNGPILGGRAEFVNAGAHKAWTATRLAGGVATAGVSTLAGRKNKGAAVIVATFGDGAVESYKVNPKPLDLKSASQYVNAFNALAAQMAEEQDPGLETESVQPQPLSVADELGKLKALSEQGVLDQQEFDQQKARLLGKER